MTYTARERNLTRRRIYLRSYAQAQAAGTPTSLVTADEARDYITALTALGWSAAAIHHLTNGQVHKATIANILRGKHHSLQRATATALLDIPNTLAPTDAVPDNCWVPTLGARRRIEALKRNGWTHRMISRASSVDTEGPLRGRSLQMPAGNWRAIDGVYRRLAMEMGPDRKASTWALKAGSSSALAWDDIDDPNEIAAAAYVDRSPHSAARANEYDPAVVARVLAGDWRHPATKAERFAIVAAYAGDHNELERRTGWNVSRYITRTDGAA